MDVKQAEEIRERFKTVRENIKNASGGREVTLLAATKTVSAENINFAIKELSLRYIGENRAQELLEKYPYIEKDGVEIHLIGGLQTNKVRQIVDKVDVIESLDSIRLAKEIDKRAAAIGKVMRVLVEINIGREPEKGGIMPEDTEAFIREAAELKSIRIEGIMTMAPAKITEREYEEYFRQTKEIFEKMKALNVPGTDIKTLSMGMSDSYEAAARCGADLVRVGSALFGKRVYPTEGAV